ncbi:hypothetical protein [Altererythrobacter sp. GH1-8]|uniref:hypothetical protein n=1 Tax=Altererythrobacter sp. GH1-8 TaxID=3349333 RepID=UPI00374DD338
MKRFLGCGCVGLLALLGLFAYLLMQTDSGEWILALILLYGGIMIGGAVAHDTVPGTVTEVRRIENPTAIQAGSVRFTYEDLDGNAQSAFRRVMYSTSKFEALEVGDEIRVWVCKSDPSVVKLVGYGTHEPETCGTGSASTQQGL